MRVKSVRDSLLSALCIISWFVISTRIFLADKTDHAVPYMLITYLATIGSGILGGILLIFLDILKKGKLKHLFIYNLFATSNVLAGAFGLALFSFPHGKSPYVAAASITVGIAMYKAIYSTNLR